MKNYKYLTDEMVTREQYNAFFKYMSILPNPDKVLRRTGKTFEAYRDLKNDPHVWACVQSRKSGLLALEHIINPNGASVNVINELEKILSDIDVRQMERDILEAPLFGYQPLEIMWKVTGQNQKFIVPVEVVPKPQEWFFFDSQGTLKFRKTGKPQGETPPPFKIINPRFEASYLNPYGHSLLSKCYWPVTFKNGGIKFWVSFTEKYGMPLMIGQYTRGATSDEVRKLAETMANMVEDAVIVTPSDIDIKLQEAVRTSSSGLFRDLIKFCNAEISKAILSQTLTTELDMGSYAATQTHYKIRREVILSDIRLVESAVNQLISYIFKLNFNSAAIPKFSILANDSENMQKIERDLKISQTGTIKLTKKYWMNSYGFKEDELE